MDQAPNREERASDSLDISDEWMDGWISCRYHTTPLVVSYTWCTFNHGKLVQILFSRRNPRQMFFVFSPEAVLKMSWVIHCSSKTRTKRNYFGIYFMVFRCRDCSDDIINIPLNDISIYQKKYSLNSTNDYSGNVWF